jgi:hypothetical protein
MHAEGSNNHTPAQSGSPRIPRPLLPQFLTGQPTGAQEHPNQELDVNSSYNEYEALDENIREKFSYLDFYSLKQRNRPREWNRAAQNQQNFDLMRKVGRLTIPPFDGSARSTARALLQKLDTYWKRVILSEAVGSIGGAVPFSL